MSKSISMLITVLFLYWSFCFIFEGQEKFTDTGRFPFNEGSILNRFYCVSQGRSFRCWRRSNPTTWPTFCCPWSTRSSTRDKQAANCLPAATSQVPTALDSSVLAKDRTKDLPRPYHTQFIHIRWACANQHYVVLCRIGANKQ